MKLTEILNSRGDRAILLYCLAVSIFIWIFTKMSNTYPAMRTVEIEYMLPDGYIFDKLPPDNFVINIDGLGWDLLKESILHRNMKTVINVHDEPLNHLDQNRLLASLDERYLNRNKINIVSVSPSYIPLNYQALEKKKIPIQLLHNILYKKEFFPLEPIITYPDTVTIYGSKNQLDSIKVWSLDQIELHNVESDIMLKIALQTESDSKNSIKVEPDSIFISQRVEQYTEKTIYTSINIPDYINKDSVIIFPREVELSFQVPLSLYNEIDSSYFNVMVRLKDINVSKAKETVALIELVEKPDYIKFPNITPKTVYFLKE